MAVPEHESQIVGSENQVSAANTLGIKGAREVASGAGVKAVEMSELGGATSSQLGVGEVTGNTIAIWRPATDVETTTVSQTTSDIASQEEKPNVSTEPATISGPQVIITLLIPSTDSRHKFVIEKKYLEKRNVSIADNNPVNMGVYTLKELIWRDWREGTAITFTHCSL